MKSYANKSESVRVEPEDNMSDTIACNACGQPVVVPEDLEAAIHCPRCQSAIVAKAVPLAEPLVAEAVMAEDQPASSEESPGFNFGHAPPAFVDELLEGQRVADAGHGPHTVPFKDWERVGTGLSLVGNATVTIVVLQVLNFVSGLALPHVVTKKADAQAAALVILFVLGLVYLCALVMGFCGLLMSCQVPAKSRLGGWGTAAIIAVMLSVGAFTLAAILVVFSGLDDVSLICLALAVLALLIGGGLYLLFLARLAAHLGDDALSRHLDTYLVVLVLTTLAMPLLIFFIVLVVAATWRDFELYHRPVGEVIGMGIFVVSVAFNLRFFVLVRQLRDRLQSRMC